MKNKNLKYVKCNLCGSDHYRVIYKYRGIPALGRFKASGNEVSKDRIVECKKCGLVYVNPRLKENKIISSYSSGCDKKFVSQNKGREKTFKKSIKVLGKYAKKGKLLDIGTAGGSFIYVAKQNGWEVYGIEPNKWLCNWGWKNYGIKINKGTLFDYKYPNNFFDMITLWDVLEHVTDPIKTLRECNRILKKDGMLLINYPDIGSIAARLMKGKWIFLLSVHLFYFNRKTIKHMLDITEFEVVKINPHIQTLSLEYLVQRIKPYSRSIHKMASKIINTFDIGNWEIPYWLGQTLVLAKKV